MDFSTSEAEACRRLVQVALEEDLGQSGDVTSKAVIPADLQGQAVFVARQPGVLAGLPAARMVFETIDGRVKFAPLAEDARHIQKGDRLAAIAGPMRGILAAERTALNFLQHMSGIAALTRRYVDAIAGLDCKLLDTRKTLPGWRLLAKYAVRCGGGHNHRLGLFDGILIKDNHWLSLGGRSLPTIAALCRAPRQAGQEVFLEVEVDDLRQLNDVLILEPDMVLLDNMTIEQMQEAVRCRNALAPEVLLEASGGVNLENVRAIAATGVDRISVGALTHSAPALDIALDYDR